MYPSVLTIVFKDHMTACIHGENKGIQGEALG
jgi:hypothetical protein